MLAQTPLIDGHNDLPWEIRTRFHSDLTAIDLAASTARLPLAGGAHAAFSSSETALPPLMTDIPRLRRGGVGGQFWSVFVDTSMQGPLAVQATLEQIDIVKGMCARYPKDFGMAYTAADVVRLHKAHRIACLIGVEGGHQINDSLAVLRAYYDDGARYMTLTHAINTAWADSATDNPAHHGLTAFGREVVREMNWLGMLVDLSHVSEETMRAALEVSEAPVMFSHSSARALVDHPRDVPDDVLRLVAKNGGVVMVNFATIYVSDARRRWERRPRRRAGALQQPAVRRPVHRPAGARRGGAQGLGRGTSAAAGDAHGRGRPHRSHPQGRGRRPRRARLGLRRHPGHARRPRRGRQVSGAA